MTNSDSYYLIGAGHTYCQDYAYHGKSTNGRFVYSVVCDGCSGSKNSDIGARIFAHAFLDSAQFALEACKSPDRNIPGIVANSMLERVQVWDFAPDSLFATVIGIIYDVMEDSLYSFVWGDGKIVYKYKTGNRYLTDIGYVKNAPFYLGYRLLKDGEAAYETEFGTLYADIQGYTITDKAAIAIPESFKGLVKFHFEKYPNASKDLSYASVFSDGIDTFHKKENSNIMMPKHEIINHLMAYKNSHGEFVKRRMMAFKKFCEKEGWQSFDDVGVGTISFE